MVLVTFIHPSASPIVPNCSSLWFARMLLRIIKRREFSLGAMAMGGSRIPCTMVPLSQPCEVMSPRSLPFPLSPAKFLQSTPRGHYSAAYQKILYSLSQQFKVWDVLVFFTFLCNTRHIFIISISLAHHLLTGIPIAFVSAFSSPPPTPLFQKSRKEHKQIRK